ncbi:MAG: lysylphosphatidylglycerol synthase transmembrane domain-containing protein [Phycisphaerales bacterium]
MTAQIPADKPKKPLMTVLRIVVSVGLLAFLFYKEGPGKIAGAIQSADPTMVGLIFLLMFVEHVHGTYKWMILLRHTSSNIPFWPMLRIRYLSAFIGIFGLGAVTIELVRMYGLARYTSDLAMSFTSILMDRLLGLTGLSLMILFGVVMESRSRVEGIELWAGGALFLILAGWFAIMNPGFRRMTDKLLSPRWLAKVRDKQNKVYMSLDTYRGRPGLMAWAMVQSLIFNVLRILVIWAGAVAVGIEVPMNAYFVVVPAVIFAMLIPISMSGWGVREAMFVALLPLYGAHPDTVLAMSLLVGVCAVLSTLPGAVILMTGMGAPKPNGTMPNPSEQH